MQSIQLYMSKVVAFFRIYKRITFTGSIAAAGLLLSLWNTNWQCSERTRTEYEENAFRYHPELTITQAQFFVPFKPGGAVLDTSTPEPTILFTFNYDTARVRLYLRNNGNAPAMLVGHGVDDTMSTEPLLRSRVLESDEQLLVTEWHPYYRDWQIVKEASDSLDLELIVKRDPNQQGVFHFALYYENQRGVLFDTYCWLPYRVGGPALPNPDRLYRPGDTIHLESQQKLSDQLILIQDKRLSMKSYTKYEAEKFKERMREHQSQ